MSELSNLNIIGRDIIGAAFEVRRNAGRFFREKYYRQALEYELKQKGYKVEKEKILPALYKNVEIEDAYRMDLVVNDAVVIELKALPIVGSDEFRQLLSYLTLSKYKLGYLINFGAYDFGVAKEEEKFDQNHGIYRFVNGI